MNYFDLFRRAVISGCICSIFYHGFMLVTGTPVVLKEAVVFTLTFIPLYFLWLVLVTKRK